MDHGKALLFLEKESINRYDASKEQCYGVKRVQGLRTVRAGEAGNRS
jgi:hypothetical protein